MMIQLNSTRVKAPTLHPAPASSVYDDATSKPSGRVESDSCSKTVTKPHFIKRYSGTSATSLGARDAGLDVGDVRTAMLDRAVWRQIVDGISIEDRPK